MRLTGNRTYFIHLVILVVSLSIVPDVTAQSSMDYNWYLNINGGALQLYGDIETGGNPIEKFPDETDYGFGLRAGRYLSPVFALHAQYLYGGLIGINEISQTQTISSFHELGAGLSVNLLNLFFINKSRRVNAYAFLGAGPIFFRSQVSDIQSGEIFESVGYSADDPQKKSSPETGFQFPIGAGIDVKLTEQWYLNLETSVRLTTSDQLDVYEKGSSNDAYSYTSLGVSYNFGKKSPKVLKPVQDELAKVPVNPFANARVDLQYRFPMELTSEEEFIMETRIIKGRIDGRAELTQILPIGFNVLDTVIDEATRINFKNYTLSLYWDQLNPKDSVITVAYRVKLDKIYGTLPMSSILYLEKTGKEYRYKTEVFIMKKKEEELVVALDEEPEIEKVKTSVSEVEFRIQVRASYKKPLSIETLEKLFNLPNQISEEISDNWYKYTTGSFRTYDAARERRKVLINEHNATGAFIIGYFNGERLSNLKDLQTLSPSDYPYPIDPTYLKRQICYRVQILALSNSEVSPTSLKNLYGIEQEVNEEVYYNWKKYTVGNCLTKEDALRVTKELIGKGIKDAFPVIYKNGERSVFRNQ